MQATFIVNPASGGRLGAGLDAGLRASGESVHDIRQGGLERIIASAPGPLVACGGDGTAAAVLDVVHRSGRELAVAVIPLGTGNDLARHLGWPTAPPRISRIQTWLAHALAAPERRLDRWILEGPGCERAWFNYWSLGDDAAAAARFHQVRRVQPWLARGRLVNKALYGVCGLLGAGVHLRGGLDLGLPAGSGALVVASIPSYAGGLCLGPGIRADDGILDLYALPHGLSLGLVLARLRQGRLIGRRSGIDFRILHRMPMQLDGEPFVGSPGWWRIRREGQVRVLAGPLAQAS